MPLRIPPRHSASRRGPPVYNISRTPLEWVDCDRDGNWSGNMYMVGGELFDEAPAHQEVIGLPQPPPPVPIIPPPHLRPAVRTCTADCLKSILEEYTNLLHERDAVGFQGLDAAIMNRVETEIKEYLGTIFENYYSLTDMADSGLIEGSLQQPDRPPAALEPAVALLGRLNNGEVTNDQSWLKERFKIAAKKKYMRLLHSCDQEMCPPAGRDIANNEQQRQRPSSSQGGQYNTPNASGNSQMQLQMQYQQQPPVHPEALKLQQYKKVEALAMALRNDLEYDMRIHVSAVLPPFLNLPAVVAEIYCEELTGRLLHLLFEMPLEHPAVEVVDVVVSIGRLQEYLLRHNVLPTIKADSCLDTTVLFGYIAREWIATTEMQMIGRCHALESGYLLGRWGLPDGRSENPFGLSPLITGIVELLEDQMAKFERIFVSWHSLGPFLEKAIASVVGASVAAVSKHCGMLSGIPSLHIESGQHITPNCSNGGGLLSSLTQSPHIKNAKSMLEATIMWLRNMQNNITERE